MNSYLYAGGDAAVFTGDVVGIFDLDAVTVMKSSRDYLERAQDEDIVEFAGGDIPGSFILTDGKDGKKVILSHNSTNNLLSKLNFS